MMNLLIRIVRNEHLAITVLSAFEATWIRVEKSSFKIDRFSIVNKKIRTKFQKVIQILHCGLSVCFACIRGMVSGYKCSRLDSEYIMKTIA